MLRSVKASRRVTSSGSACPRIDVPLFVFTVGVQRKTDEDYGREWSREDGWIDWKIDRRINKYMYRWIESKINR